MIDRILHKCQYISEINLSALQFTLINSTFENNKFVDISLML